MARVLGPLVMLQGRVQVAVPDKGSSPCKQSPVLVQFCSLDAFQVLFHGRAQAFFFYPLNIIILYSSKIQCESKDGVGRADPHSGS